MGTDKRERQKTARQLKIEAEQRAATRDRRKRTAVRLAVTAVVAVAGLFLYTVLWGDADDDADAETAADDSATVDDSTSTTVPEIACDSPDVAAAVGREAPETEPPPGDTPADALEVTTLVEGQGEGAVAGDTVVVHYVGRDATGRIFDCSWQASAGGQPFSVEPLGQAGVIDGWNEGLIGAKAGERRRLVIGSDKAYGPTGNPGGGIPPDMPLAFEIDVVEVVPAG